MLFIILIIGIINTFTSEDFFWKKNSLNWTQKNLAKFLVIFSTKGDTQ